MKKWRKFLLDYFDWNESGKVEWWEYCLPFVIIIIMEVIAELIARLIF